MATLVRGEPDTKKNAPGKRRVADSSKNGVVLGLRDAFVARELAPARLRSSRNAGDCTLSDRTLLQVLGLLRSPAGASSLATTARQPFSPSARQPVSPSH